MLAYYYYLALEGFAFIICFLVFQNLSKKHSPMLDEIVFLYLIFSNMAILCLDSITWYADGKIFPLSNFLLVWSNVLYYMISAIILFLWLLYVSLRLSKRHMRMPFLIAILLPVLFELVMSITAPFNGLYFYVDAANVYHRGSLCWTQAYIGIAYMLFAAAYAFIHGIRAKDSQTKKESFMLVSFTFFPLLCSIVQSQFFGLPLIWIGTTISFMMFFMQTQNSQISMDALTRMNNRGKFDVYLSQKLRDLRANETLSLVVMDIDDFKTINDSYGHVEGDDALIAFAELLMKACAEKKDFSARYGGDEFTLICIRPKAESIQPLIERIEDLLADFNRQNGKPYALRISYGIAIFGEDSILTDDALKRRADERMYAMKAAHHSGAVAGA